MPRRAHRDVPATVVAIFQRPSHAVFADAPGTRTQRGSVQKRGKAVFGFLAGIFVVGAPGGLAIGFFIGRAVGRRTPDNVGS